MGRVLLCVGKTAERPYYMEKVCQNVYSAEELCFLIRKNAYLLDETIVDKKLADWLGKECGLNELSRQLSGFIRSGCSVAAFVAVLLEQIGYCTGEEIAAVEQLLKNNAGLSGRERQKVHADYLVQNGYFGRALGEYETLLSGLEKEDPLRARILHNMGTACAGMYRFDRAAVLLKEAAELTGEAEDMEDYLAALRLSMKEADYVSRIAGKPEYTEGSLALEKRFAQAVSQWKASESGAAWQRLTGLKREGKKMDYYGQAEEAVAELKESYRKSMS